MSHIILWKLNLRQIVITFRKIVSAGVDSFRKYVIMERTEHGVTHDAPRDKPFRQAVPPDQRAGRAGELPELRDVPRDRRVQPAGPGARCQPGGGDRAGASSGPRRRGPGRGSKRRGTVEAPQGCGEEGEGPQACPAG